jgi:preprotein translocase subunit SecB
MTEKFKILTQYIKDISGETNDVETYLFVKENISKYHLNIDIISKALKNKLIEVNTSLKFEDKENNEKKSYFEMIYASVISVDNDIKEKKDLEKIILCDVQKIIYPNIEKAFLNLIHNSGFPEIKFEKKVDFEKLYNERFN